MKNLLSKILILSAFLALFVSCSSSDSPASTPVDIKPTISSFSPLNGGFGSTIIISGTNFSTTPTDNTVTINGVAATVIAATATQLTVTVPDCKGTGDVKVTVANKTSTATDKFTYTFDVYAVGSEYNGIRNVAKLWKNGVATSLTDGSKNAVATGVYVKNTDVYVVGYENNGTVDIAKLWVNGLAFPLSNTVSHAVGITYDQQLYIYGDAINSKYNVKNSTGAIWNGDGSLNWQQSTVPNSTIIYTDNNGGVAFNFGTNQTTAGVYLTNQNYEFNGRLNNGFKKGSDLYFVGTTNGNHGKLIKNVLDISFNTPANTLFYDVCIDDTDTNIVGSVETFPKLWVNGALVNLNDGTKTGRAEAIDMYAKNVIIGGKVYEGQNDNGVAKLWINRRAFNLTDGTHDAECIDVFIKPIN